MTDSRPIVILSGGFDPYHDGHARMFEAASRIGEICVILNSNNWLLRKKGNFFMNSDERALVVGSIKGVEYVYLSKDADDTVCEDLKDIASIFKDKVLFFGNGGDRGESNTPEMNTCKDYGIHLLFNLGGNNDQSSSKLLQRWCNLEKERGELNV